LLAFIDLPDFATPVRRAVTALETLANIPPPPKEEPEPKAEDVQYVIVTVEETAPAPQEKHHA
jgi:hypothetical protein